MLTSGPGRYKSVMSGSHHMLTSDLGDLLNLLMTFHISHAYLGSGKIKTSGPYKLCISKPMPAGAFSYPKNNLKNYVSPSRCPQGLFRTQKPPPGGPGGQKYRFAYVKHDFSTKSSVSLMREATFWGKVSFRLYETILFSTPDYPDDLDEMVPEPALRPSLPHAPGARMTAVK